MVGTKKLTQKLIVLAAVLSLAASGAAAGSAGSTANSTGDSSAESSVIVQAKSAKAAAAAVHRFGGDVVRRLPLIRGVEASMTSAGVDSLRRRRAVWQVTANGSVGFEGSADPTLSAQRVQKVVRSNELWDEGVTGQGVTVALLDTGVYADHPDLAGRVVHCEDFSHEAGTEAECADTFGHGTFMAGLIAGDGTSSGGDFMGAAPDAKIVSIKLAGFDGATDVSHVLAGIQWAVSHKAAYGIRVMNLSLGTDSTQSYLLSPLNYAVQRAWKAGIVVVVSAGNNGPGSRTVLKPADDPYVVTVGAANDENTPTISDDVVPVFSSRGPTSSNGLAKPDVVAPGVHTISLRSPGSAIDQAYGATAAVGEGYFRGTGTSMSAATVTGIAAQVIQAQPSLVPDQVKYRLTSTARRIASTDKYGVGAGEVDAYRAARSTATTRANQGLLLGLGNGLGNGLGSLKNDRGSLELNVVTPVGEATLSGNLQPLYSTLLSTLTNPLGLLSFNSLTYTTTGWDPLTWPLTSWATADWGAAKWKDGAWSATTLEAAKWKDGVWEAAKWKGAGWSNADWVAAKWKDLDWDAAKWKASNFQTAWYAAAWD
jgi:serine protease AprX